MEDEDGVVLNWLLAHSSPQRFIFSDSKFTSVSEMRLIDRLSHMISYVISVWNTFGSDSSQDPDVLSEYKVWWEQLLQLGTRRYHSHRDESQRLLQTASEQHRLLHNQHHPKVRGLGLSWYGARENRDTVKITFRHVIWGPGAIRYEEESKTAAVTTGSRRYEVRSQQLSFCDT